MLEVTAELPMLALICRRLYAYCHGLEFGMVDVRGDDHASASDFVAHNSGAIFSR